MGPEDAELRSEWMRYYQDAQKKPPPPAVVPVPVPSPPPVPAAPVAPCPNSGDQAKTRREVKGVVMKRKNIHITEDDKYGHWWFEIDGKESYGWWPKGAVGLKETFGGTDGELNGQSTFNGTPTMDPHHGDAADEEFHPMVSCTDKRTDSEIKDCLRGFANAYSGGWRWTFGAGQNCHSFQNAAMEHCRLEQP